MTVPHATALHIGGGAAGHNAALRCAALDVARSRAALRGPGRGKKPRRVARPGRGGYRAVMILLRHGQSQFNAAFTATRRDPGIPDPRLTALGEAQARQAADDLADEGIEHIIASPYTRALQTAAPLAQMLGLTVTVNAVVRERYAFSCDVGSPRRSLTLAWPALDFSHLDDVWWPAITEPADAVLDRATLFRTEMAALPHWNRTVVVTHWGFILSLTGVSLNNGSWLRCDPTAAAPHSINWTA